MSRLSGDEYKNGRLMNGYDYDNQAWVKDGKYVDCGHPDTMTCDCYGRLHKGEETASPEEDLSFVPCDTNRTFIKTHADIWRKYTIPRQEELADINIEIILRIVGQVIPVEIRDDIDVALKMAYLAGRDSKE
jgi:hypothetical protein